MSLGQDTLFYGLVLFFGLTLSVYLYLAPNPGPQALRTIEIDMADTPDDRGRDIPLPKRRTNVPTPHDSVPLQAAPMPAAPPAMPLSPSSDAPALAAVPDYPAADSGLSGFSGLATTAADAMAGFMTRQDYYELVKMRVEALKKYPDRARKDAAQGEVVVRFQLDGNGGVSALTVHKSSGSESLDRAALRAVREATPFPHPPSGLFQFPLRLQLAIQFMLT